MAGGFEDVKLSPEMPFGFGGKGHPKLKHLRSEIFFDGGLQCSFRLKGHLVAFEGHVNLVMVTVQYSTYNIVQYSTV